MNARGSSMLFIILAMSVVSVVITAAMRCTIFDYEVALERVKYEQQFWLAQAYATYAQAYVQAHSKELRAVRHEIALAPSFLMTTKQTTHHEYSGHLHLFPQKEGIDVTVKLQRNHKTIMTIAFFYHTKCDDNNNIISTSIADWRMHSEESA